MKNHIGTTVGHNIKKLRKKRAITQEQLAEKIKTSYKYIQRIEGKTPPDIRLTTLERIATALEIPSTKLLDE